MTKIIVICLFAGLVLDLIIGDPPKLPHPVRLIGRLIIWLDKKLRCGEDSPEKQRLKGGIFAFLTVFLTVFVTGAAAVFFYWLHPVLGLLVCVVLSAYCLASRSMAEAAMSVYRPLRAGDLEGARRAVSMIVGRDTEALDEAGITRAAVESVAESTSDGVIAPLFYLAIGGPVLAMAYKAVNTMDSMVGYTNDTYRYFGTAAARFDDVLNYLPARLSALFMMAAAAFFNDDVIGAWRIWRRDRRKHASPNSAQTESVCAGALGVRLAGDAVYFGKVKKKPYIGDDTRPIEAEDIRRACRLMYGTTVLAALVFAGIRVLIGCLI